MTSSWCLHERTKLGGDCAQWILSREEELRVGRDSDSSIKFHSRSQSVENKHALFRWDQRSVAFTLQDLGTINGTYVNNRPLRNGSVVLQHNDSIRFGYDKDRVFRMEECFSSTKNSPTTITSTQSPTRVPVSAPPQSLPPSTSIAIPSSPVSSPDHTPSIRVESEQPSKPTIQHALPIIPADDDLTSSLGSPHRCDGRRSVDLDHSPALNRASKLYGKPDWWGEAGPGQEGMAEARQREFEFAKPGSQILRQLDPPEVRRDLAPKLSVKDELRLQSISSSDPAASWVIDFGGGGSGGTLPRVRRARDHTSRPRSADPSPNRLTSRRDPSPVPKRAVTPTSSRPTPINVHTPPRTTASRRQRENTPPITRSTETGSRRPSYGDKLSSPKRKSQKKPNPLIATLQSGTPQHSKPPSPQRSKPPSPLRFKTPQVKGAQSKTHQSKPATTHSEIVGSQSKSSPRSRTISPPDFSATLPNPPHITTEVNRYDDLSETTSIDLKHLNEGGKMSHLVKDDATYTAQPISSDECNSLSSLSDHTLSLPTEKPAMVVTSSAGVGSEEGKEEGPRKQWTSEGAQSPDSLMIANIEARMRRLSRIAHQTARQVTSLKNRVQEGYQMQVKVVDYLSLRDTSPVVTRAEQHLPEWKSYNKEAHSIFRNMRVVEKWLQDIDGTLNSIKPVNTSGEECVDFASDGELYLDTVESPSNSELSDN